MKSYLVIFLLFASFNAIYGYDYDHYIFAQQWSGSFCEVNNYCVRKLTERNEWTIHGLWPSSSDGSSPQFCPRGNPFDVNKLKSIEDELKDKWPSYSSPTVKFWKHEWEKHGKCVTKQRAAVPEIMYFRQALELHNRFNIFRALKNNNIVPSMKKWYKVSDIKEALQKEYGIDVILSCQKKNNIVYLTESRTCLDLELRPIRCFKSSGSCNSKGQVKYLPSGSRGLHALHLGSIQPFLFSLLFLLIPFWLS